MNLTMNTKIILSVIILLFVGGNVAKAQDWPNLSRYQVANQRLKDSTVKVVYMGNSITEAWAQMSPDFFADNRYINRGISGQTTPQMLLRFRQDVIELKPKIVVLLCGINDIAGNTGPSTLEMIEANIMSMAELAKANKIKMILCSLLPANHFKWKPTLQPADSVIALNKWISAYAHSRHLEYVDFYSQMVDTEKGLKAAYTYDGLHPTIDGYKIMQPLVKAAISKIL